MEQGYRWPFNLVDEDNPNNQVILTLSIEDASNLVKFLADSGTMIVVEPVHPEFPGWEPRE